MSQKYILLLGSNQFQRERSICGVEKAYNGIVVTTKSNQFSQKNKYHFHQITTEESNPKELFESVIKFNKKFNLSPEAVIPLNDFVLESGYKIAKEFNLNYNSAETIKNCREKDKLKEILSKAGLNVVKSYRFKTYEEGIKIAKKIKFPVVIKPLNFGGSGGVIKIESEINFKEKFDELKNHILLYGPKYNVILDTFLVEPYIIEKNEISVEVLNTPNFRSVIGITDKFLGKEPYFSEIGHQIPSQLNQNKKIKNKIEEIALKVCELLNIQYGISHIEMKASFENSPIIIEIGCRTAGDSILDLYEKSTFINMYYLHTLSYLNKLLLPPQINFQLNSAIGFLHPKNGIIKNILLDKIPKLENTNNIHRIIINASNNQNIYEAKDWTTRYGFIEFWGQDNNTFNIINSTNKICNEIFEISNE